MDFFVSWLVSLFAYSLFLAGCFAVVGGDGFVYFLQTVDSMLICLVLFVVTRFCHRQVEEKGYAVVVVAEGAGEGLLGESTAKDASG